MNREEALRRYYLNPKICLNCGEIIRVRDVEHPAETRKKKFCSQSCSATYNNRISPKREKDFNISVQPESIEEMLERASAKVYIPNAVKIGEKVSLPETAKVNVYGKILEIPVEWNKNDEVITNEIQLYTNTQIVEILKFNGRTYRKTYNIKVR